MSADRLIKLKVVYQGWGEHWPLGTLADVVGRLLFEYSAQAIERGLQFSPMRVPLPCPGAAQAAYSSQGPGGQHTSLLQGLPIRRATLQAINRTLLPVWKSLETHQHAGTATSPFNP